MPLIVSVVTRTCKQASTSGTVEACLHVLVTTDTMSGIWTYTRELVSGLVSRGTRVTLVSFGEIPLPEQITWMNNLHGLEYRPTAFRLDWMQEGEQDLDEDRKSTRLNSSHLVISYAVFCLKKKIVLNRISY